MTHKELHLNTTLQAMDIYASKAISARAKRDPSIVGLSFGEPEFGPPEHLKQAIASEDLSLDAFLDSCKRYEDARGSLALRRAIAAWYRERHGLVVDPDTEIMVTHGGVEAITLAILCTTEPGEAVAVSDPTYMLYERTVRAVAREAVPLARPPGDSEYAEALARLGPAEHAALDRCRTLIVNSPENPSGYVASPQDWSALAGLCERHGLWLIHDEVYDSMDFGRRHVPARAVPALADRSIMINSFSKKFGMPGMRIGWMVAKPELISLAAKLHDYMYLGVNIQYERIALRLLSDATQSPAWLDTQRGMLQQRAHEALERLDARAGYAWPRRPLGAMFLFPDVSALATKLPDIWRTKYATAGEAVANWLLEEVKVAVVPGVVYGKQSANHVRMVLCPPAEPYQLAIQRLAEARA
ncbi:pyridoxal phosphate-dependent aminotransferase [Ramlibacter sp.]|uniref:pyridoxal phosphate-dependent aminotransferase n=1 Tax=Ramlibacter sp. TaxID=1917967 RepID=UPI0025D28C0D|nr:pyridoxal phosphate-dependent aminotransferase [Ramlibacter sp.]